MRVQQVDYRQRAESPPRAFVRAEKHIYGARASTAQRDVQGRACGARHVSASALGRLRETVFGNPSRDFTLVDNPGAPIERQAGYSYPQSVGRGVGLLVLFEGVFGGPYSDRDRRSTTLEGAEGRRYLGRRGKGGLAQGKSLSPTDRNQLVPWVRTSGCEARAGVVGVLQDKGELEDGDVLGRPRSNLDEKRDRRVGECTRSDPGTLLKQGDPSSFTALARPESVGISPEYLNMLGAGNRIILIFVLNRETDLMLIESHDLPADEEWAEMEKDDMWRMHIRMRKAAQIMSGKDSAEE
ncbi:hypothetical protein C8R47DRAFT_1062576 [Mycena vitilis]|nr:hypothetical protein C8R47DRAFT_1062576 [Mycena vitilis]